MRSGKERGRDGGIKPMVVERKYEGTMEKTRRKKTPVERRQRMRIDEDG